MILLDTHVLIWLDEGSSQLGAVSRKLIDKALQDEHLAVSSISFWEISMLRAKERIMLSISTNQLRSELIGSGLQEIPITGDIGILAAELENFHGDPADRLITATTIKKSATLITADKKILAWKNACHRMDARQ